MEFIKKSILQKNKLNVVTTSTGSTCTIIPDTNAVYNFKIVLTSEVKNLGFFNVNMDYDVPQISSNPVIVTGTTESRLSELLKYTITENFINMYLVYDGFNGVDYATSPSNQNITYYINEIKYHDIIVDGVSTTSYEFYTIGSTSPQFINAPYFKDFNNENIVSNPEIKDDVFIDRQQISAFENNYRLEYIKSLLDLETYAGGNFFKIVNNT